MARGPRTHKRQAANKAVLGGVGGDRQHFRFFDNRKKYLLFVTTCSEKWMVAQRIGMELSHLRPRPPALKLFDAGMGDGTVLSHVMRDLHRQFPHTPWLIVGKEISMEDVRLSLEKLADRFFEHPQTIVCVTNMYYTEAPHLMPRTDQASADLQWFERPLESNSARDFDEQIRKVTTDLMGHWQVRISERTGNPPFGGSNPSAPTNKTPQFH